MLRQRRPAAEPAVLTAVPAREKGSPMHPEMQADADADEQAPLLPRQDVTASVDPVPTGRVTDGTSSTTGYLGKNRWMALAIASGACAAFNGVFAKLTTTDLTTSFAHGIARILHVESVETAIEYIVRAMFFGLNLIFNGVMWTLFTQALAKGNSTTQVSIMNTSSNFFITAVLGFVIFSESLPPLWWVGAALLVAGNVLIGSQDESETAKGDEPPLGPDELGNYQDLALADATTDGLAATPLEDEDFVELGDLNDLDERS